MEGIPSWERKFSENEVDLEEGILKARSGRKGSQMPFSKIGSGNLMSKINNETDEILQEGSEDDQNLSNSGSYGQIIKVNLEEQKFCRMKSPDEEVKQ